MPAMDLALIQSLGRDLHSHSPGYMGEDEVCPWTLFLTMALTLLKGWSILISTPGISSQPPKWEYKMVKEPEPQIKQTNIAVKYHLSNEI